MTNEEFETTVEPLLDTRPFQNFIIETVDGERHLIESPRAIGYRNGSVTYGTRGRGPRFLNCVDIRRIFPAVAAEKASVS